MTTHPLKAHDHGSERVDSGWLERFHRGDRATLEECYRRHFHTVKRVVESVVSGADQETVIHELFSKLIAREELRRNFQGGSFAAWLGTVARNRALDHRRRSGREVELLDKDTQQADTTWEHATQARLLVEQFRMSQLPAEWREVFDLRFLQQLSQHETARRLSMSRTTLAYRELRIRALLRRFLLESEHEP